VKQEKQDEIESKPRDRSSSMNSNSNHSHSSYKERKRKRIDDNNSLLPPTNHERMQNGDLTPPTSTMLGSSVKPEVLKKVYVSYFERNDETDHEFRMVVIQQQESKVLIKKAKRWPKCSNASIFFRQLL
jgi:hypothetical protein